MVSQILLRENLRKHFCVTTKDQSGWKQPIQYSAEDKNIQLAFVDSVWKEIVSYCAFYNGSCNHCLTEGIISFLSNICKKPLPKCGCNGCTGNSQNKYVFVYQWWKESVSYCTLYNQSCNHCLSKGINGQNKYVFVYHRWHFDHYIFKQESNPSTKYGNSVELISLKPLYDFLDIINFSFGVHTH